MLTQARIHELLSYNQETGIFTWKESKGNRGCGNIAGGIISSGYIRIYIDKVPYMAHNLAWLYVYGTFPENELDHKDTNKINNPITNLRPCTRSQNNANTKKRSDNTSGYKGVRWRKDVKKWESRIFLRGKFKVLGYFKKDELDKAAKAYELASRHYFGEFARPA